MDDGEKFFVAALIVSGWSWMTDYPWPVDAAILFAIALITYNIYWKERAR